MERYKNFVRMEQMKEHIRLDHREMALEIADTFELKKVRSTSDLSIMADLYMDSGMLTRAQECLLELYSRNKTRGILMKLINLSIRLKDVNSAEKYYHEFRLMAIGDFYVYIFRYNIDKIEGKPYNVLISSLEKLKDAEYIDKWAYELAKLYHKAGERAKCIAECRDIETWFGDGEYVERAKALRAYYEGNLNLSELDGQTDAQGESAEDSTDGNVYGDSEGDSGNSGETYGAEDLCEVEAESPENVNGIQSEDIPSEAGIKGTEGILASEEEVQEISPAEDELSLAELEQEMLRNKLADEVIAAVGEALTRSPEFEELMGNASGSDGSEGPDIDEIRALQEENYDETEDSPTQPYKLNGEAFTEPDSGEEAAGQSGSTEAAEYTEADIEGADRRADDGADIQPADVSGEESAEGQEADEPADSVLGYSAADEQEADAPADSVRGYSTADEQAADEPADSVRGYSAADEQEADEPKADASAESGVEGANGRNEGSIKEAAGYTEPAYMTNDEYPDAVSEEAVTKLYEAEEAAVAGIIAESFNNAEEDSRNEAAPMTDEEAVSVVKRSLGFQRMDTELETVDEIDMNEAALAKYEFKGLKECKIAEGSKLESFLESKGFTLEDFFGYFAYQINVRGQLIRELEMMLKPNKKSICVAIMGERNSGLKGLIIGLTRFLHECGYLTSLEKANVSSTKINQMKLSEVTGALAGHCLIIRNAGMLSHESVEDLLKVNPMLAGKTAIILTDTRSSFFQLFRESSELNSMFLHRIHIPDFTERDLLDLAMYRFRKNDYLITEEAWKVVSSNLRKLQRESRQEVLIKADKYISSVIERLEERNAKVYLYNSLDGRQMSRNNLITIEDVK